MAVSRLEYKKDMKALHSLRETIRSRSTGNLAAWKAKLKNRVHETIRSSPIGSFAEWIAKADDKINADQELAKRTNPSATKSSPNPKLEAAKETFARGLRLTLHALLTAGHTASWPLRTVWNKWPVRRDLSAVAFSFILVGGNAALKDWYCPNHHTGSREGVCALVIDHIPPISHQTPVPHSHQVRCTCK